MIPVSITLQNFLSYGSQPHTVEFGPYRLICLSGKNGHGKSALLDALTWALWGQARKTTGTAKPDEGLLRLGQTDMAVSLDFIFNNQHYRVRRLFSTKYGKPSTHVDFGTYNPKDDFFSPLTEKTIKKTQDLIEQVLGLDYEGFINSSFLRQGQANEFSKKSPKDRKDIIATILGLGHYEKARKLAADKAKEASQSALQLQKIIEHLEQSCQLLPLCHTKMQATTQELATLQQQEQTLNQELLAAKNNYQQTTLQVEEAKRLHSQHTTVTAQFQQKKLLFDATVQQWKQRHSKLLQVKNPLDLAAQQEKLEQQQQELLEQKQHLLTLKELIFAKKTEYQTILAHLDQQHLATMREQNNVVEKAKQEQLLVTHNMQLLISTQKTQAGSYAQLESNIEELKKQANPELLINDTTTLVKTYERAKEFYQKWLEQGKWVAQELQELEKKQTLSHDPANPSCPLCEQNLSQARKRFLHNKFADQERFLQKRLQRLRTLLLDLKKQLEQLHAAVTVATTLDTLLMQQTALAQEQAKTQVLIQELEATLQHHTTQVCQQETISKNLELAYTHTKQEHVTLQQCMTAIARLEQETATYTGLETAYTDCVKALTLIKEQRVLCTQFQEQKQELHDQLTTIHQQADQLRTLMCSIKELEKALVPLADSQQRVTANLATLTNITQQLEQITTQKELLFQEKGGLEKQLVTLQEQEKLKQEHVLQKNTYEHDAQQYTTIAQAFGKDGIQALLIEDALPEIEQEANDLLSRLTDNQAHIFIESLRDLKRGGVKETMDINISDTSGIRPYEMFSGGEAFRIDFSLRIAISKLLARRAGTSLQTLIIDEGFGSQDEEGLMRIMDALYKVQEDFEKIIIVSHLNSMKEQFPVQFQVEKTPHGSQIKILEQG